MPTTPKQSRRTSPLWLAVGLAVGLILAPAAAVAATIGAVKLVGADNVTAQVTRAGQLETAIAQPTTFRAFYDLNLGGSTCDTVYTAPAGYSLIVQQVTIDVFADTTPGSGDTVSVATDNNCQNLLFDDNPPSNGASVFPLGPGIVVPAGHSLYAIAKDNVEAEIYGYGYLVPVADAPSATQSTLGIVRANSARRASERH
jgi:hypothetical protein